MSSWKRFGRHILKVTVTTENNVTHADKKVLSF
jgi:hypothetical protein